MSTCIETARQLVALGKGLLAADESLGTIKRRFDPFGIPSTEETRRAYRDTLFTTAGIEDCISGVIMFEETLGQATSSGELFPDFLARLNIIPGVKVDRGVVPLSNGSRETLTEGLDGLGERLSGYRRQGARFAKWRGVIHVEGDQLPTPYAVAANAAALARYARLCQDAELTPIVEPEVLMDGKQDIARSAEVTRATLQAVFDALYAASVSLEGMLLKPNMVVPGAASGQREAAKQVAEATLRCLRRCVPCAVSGIVFLSGGQSPHVATDHLRDMIRLGGTLPWRLSFSFGRALQDEALAAWRGRSESVTAAQAAFLHRARAVSAATLGRVG
jgi:fructose-bisphosphate aldolase, class I